MKFLHKQILILIIFVGAVFGATVYFAFQGIEQTVDAYSAQSAYLIATQFLPVLEETTAGMKLANDHENDLAKQIRQALIQEPALFKSIEDVYFVDSQNVIQFALNAKLGGQKYRSEQKVEMPLERGDAEGIQIFKSTSAHEYEALCSLRGFEGSKGVLRIKLTSGSLQRSLQRVAWKIYLIGFAAVLGAILISLITGRVMKSPVKAVENAMTAIHRRKYGYRLKSKKTDEFHGLYQKVNLALQRLEQLDSVQRTAVQRRNVLLKEIKTVSRFLDIMAHEIKNPLHAMGINLDVLKTKIRKSQSKSDTLKHAEILENEMEHLQEVVRGFLSYVRPGVPQKQRTAVNEIIKSVCQMVSAEAEKAQVSIETRMGKGLREVLLDQGQFQQALHNIVINAIHATGKDGKVFIRSWGKRKTVLVSVKDNGSGISPEELKKIFDLYYTTKKGGTGLGLPITRRIVEANGGQLQLESKVGKGTTVTFLFPTP
ncbi:MAG: PAS domain-containing sensor histidine kinase [bacterium]